MQTVCTSVSMTEFLPPFRSTRDEPTASYEELFAAHLTKDQRVDAYARIPHVDISGGSGLSPTAPIFQLAVIKHILVNIDRLVVSRIGDLCTPSTCPKMIASEEWHFLCAPHADKPRDCAAIDYMKHTVDSCTSTLLLLCTKPASVVVKQFNSIMRRLFRIFGHLYFHHSEFFNRTEVETECAKIFRFLKEFGLWKGDMAIIPESVLEGLVKGDGTVAPIKPPPMVDVKAAGTIVDLRTVALQLSEQDDDSGNVSDGTVIMG